jgi:secondary thiamine-phosphate synthase enzyme
MHKATLTVATSRAMELVDITEQVAAALGASGVKSGICHLYNPHTTAALTINEGADPDVRSDIIMALKKIIPFELPYDHAEGNSPSHVLASLFGASETVFVDQGRLLLGTWQKIYFCEFDGPRTRKVQVRIVEEK